MTNKTLLRIIRKTLGAQSAEELATFLQERKAQVNGDAQTRFSEFVEALLDCFEKIDSAITDLDKVIDIRDRSLAISSKELTGLNDQIRAESDKQREVLNQLQALLQLLRSDGSRTGQALDAAEEKAQDNLNTLVVKVNQLVKDQINSARNLKNLAEEGLRIASAMDFKSLESQLQESATNILGVGVNIKIYFAGFLFGRRSANDVALAGETNKYYSCNKKNELDEELNANASFGQSFQIISSSKGSGILAFAKMGLQSQSDDEDLKNSERSIAEYWSRLQPLLPNVATTLENIRLLQDEKQRQRLETELQMARFVQQALLPPSGPLSISNALEICGFYQNASECGGDWWSHIKMTDGRHIIFVGDVTGHGTASAMICAVVKGYCDSFVDRGADLPLSTMLEELNQVVYRIGRESGRAMTMAAIAVNPKKGELTLVNAGHPPPIRIRRDDDKSDANGLKPIVQYLIAPQGSILGLHETVTFKEKNYPLKKGDAILLYSDGVIEYMRHNREVYGDRRLYRAVALAGTNSTAYDLNQAVIRDLREFALGDEPSDDVTAVVIKAV